MSYGNGGSYGTATQAIPAGRYDGHLEAARVPSIQREMNVLVERAESIHNALTELEARLSGVLMPEPPTANGALKDPGTPPVALAAALYEHSMRLAFALQRLQALNSRIEL